MKKIAIIGKGTAGCMSATRFAQKDVEVEWYFDPEIKPQSVGEGSNLVLPNRLNEAFAFGPKDFPEIDATIKVGIYKTNWGKSNTPYLHDFPSPHCGLHFSAPKLQEYVEKKLSGHVNIKSENVLAENIDADFIVDCSGKPKSYETHSFSEYIPVNSVYVTQCYWDYPAFNYTLTIARPYGWVFGIPLGNRCSIGYLYNEDINTLEEVQLDVQNVFDEYNLKPSATTNSFSFKNYKHRDNFKDNISYNGNSSFFLEPMEATSFSTVDVVNTISERLWTNQVNKDQADRDYNAIIDATESIIMLHYSVGSSFSTDFWDYAEERGKKCIENSDDSFKFMLKNSSDTNGLGTYSDYFAAPNFLTASPEMSATYSSWWEGSFAQNVKGLGVDLNNINYNG